MKILNSNPKINLLYKSLGLTLVVIISINFISFLFKLFSTETETGFTIKFKRGLFIINGEQSGLNYSEYKYWLFYVLIFLLSVYFFKNKK